MVEGFDPLITAVPALVGIAAGIVALRIYPLPMRLAAAIARRAAGASWECWPRVGRGGVGRRRPLGRAPERREPRAAVRGRVRGDAGRAARRRPRPGAEAVARVVALTRVGLCAVAAGVADKALHITAEYATNRKQFDRAIATFQAVGQRMANAYIDTEAIKLTMLLAATRLDEGKPAETEVATAKYWASDGGSRVGHAALHVHGGISIDLDYPIHRYFLWAKGIEFTLGSGTPQLARIGRVLAAEPA